jgi:2-polyprenyl-3-methyl-5-hydroxy-6-metoxy-1,4-benzoquinol methylase
MPVEKIKRGWKVYKEEGLTGVIWGIRSNLSRMLLPLLPWRPRTSVPIRRWLNVAQKAELIHHKSGKGRESGYFHIQTARLFIHLGFTPEQYRGKVVIDIGAGSRLRTLFFKDAYIVAIEPLAEVFMKEIEWCDLHKAQELYCRPAEEFIEALRNRGDLIISINTLDHCYNFERIMDNIREYMKPDALAFLSFDSRRFTDKYHPLILTREVCERVFLEKGLIVERMTHQSKSKHITTLNYWLRKDIGRC